VVAVETVPDVVASLLADDDAVVTGDEFAVRPTSVPLASSRENS
jgi:hypothetical protein